MCFEAMWSVVFGYDRLSRLRYELPVHSQCLRVALKGNVCGLKWEVSLIYSELSTVVAGELGEEPMESGKVTWCLALDCFQFSVYRHCS